MAGTFTALLFFVVLSVISADISTTLSSNHSLISGIHGNESITTIRPVSSSTAPKAFSLDNEEDEDEDDESMSSGPHSPSPWFPMASHENGYIPPLKAKRDLISNLFGSMGNSSRVSGSDPNNSSTTSALKSSSSTPRTLLVAGDRHMVSGHNSSTAMFPSASRPKRHVSLKRMHSMITTTITPRTSSSSSPSSSSQAPNALNAEPEEETMGSQVNSSIHSMAPRYRRHASHGIGHYSHSPAYRRPVGCVHKYQTTTSTSTPAPRDILCIRNGRPIFAGDDQDHLCFKVPAPEAFTKKPHEKEDLLKKPFELFPQHPKV